jgi:two-component system chemotaxis response regulator CheY
MPKMDGLTFVRTLRAHEKPSVRDVPVILVTGDRTEDLRARGREAGANGFLQKPLSSEKLMVLVDDLLPKG